MACLAVLSFQLTGCLSAVGVSLLLSSNVLSCRSSVVALVKDRLSGCLQTMRGMLRFILWNAFPSSMDT
jgi:hypothetical protein